MIASFHDLPEIGFVLKNSSSRNEVINIDIAIQISNTRIPRKIADDTQAKAKNEDVLMVRLK
jgi:hypothetical protein